MGSGTAASQQAVAGLELVLHMHNKLGHNVYFFYCGHTVCWKLQHTKCKCPAQNAMATHHNGHMQTVSKDTLKLQGPTIDDLVAAATLHLQGCLGLTNIDLLLHA